jgi:hypothetical protein
LQSASDQGKLPEIKGFRILLAILRMAEHDYLSGTDDTWSARNVLFGGMSPLGDVCRVLGIDLRAARLLLLAWRLSGKIGDPVFRCLMDNDNVEWTISGERLRVYAPTIHEVRRVLWRLEKRRQRLATGTATAAPEPSRSWTR